MGFLEDAGRGNAFAPINNVLGRAVELRQLENQESNQAFGRAIELDKLGMMKAAEDREKTKFDYAVKELKAKEAADNMPVPVSDVLGADFTTHPGKKIQFDYMLKNGSIKEPAPGVFVTTARNASAARKEMAENVEFYKTVEEKSLQHTNSQLSQVDAAIAGDKDALKAIGAKPEELPELRKKLAQQLSEQVAAAQAIDLKFQKQKALEEAKSRVGDWQTIKDDDSVTGWSKTNSKTGDVVQGVPPPASAVSDKRATETERHNKAMEEIRKRAAGGGAGGKKTALIQNTEFLSTLGYTKEEAAKLLTASKPMSRESYIGTTTSKIMANELIPEDEKANRVREAIAIYDTFMSKPGASPTSTGAVPSGYIDTGKTHKGKKLYHNPKAPKGKEYWTP